MFPILKLPIDKPNIRPSTSNEIEDSETVSFCSGERTGKEVPNLTLGTQPNDIFSRI